MSIYIIGLFLSFIIFLLIIYRLYYNRTYQRLRVLQTTSSLINDNTSLIILANTYLVFLIANILWFSVIFRTFLGDFSLLKDKIYLGDSTFCRVQVGILFFATSELYYGFVVQALYRYIRIIYNRKQKTVALCRLKFRDFGFYILLIILSWLISFLVLIPAYTLFNVFSYLPKQYHCLVSFSNVRGYMYCVLVCFFIPSISIFWMYGRVIIFIRHLPRRGLFVETKRELKVIGNIAKLCFGITVAGSPTLFFLFQYMITGQLHSLADRIHEFWLSLNIVALNLGIAFLNSLFDIWPS